MKYLQLYIVLTRKKTLETNQGYTFRPSIRSIQNILIHFLSQFYTSFFLILKIVLIFVLINHTIYQDRILVRSFRIIISDFFLKNAFCNRSSRFLLNSVHMHFRLDFKLHKLIVWQCRHSCQLNAFMSTHFIEKV